MIAKKKNLSDPKIKHEWNLTFHSRIASSKNKKLITLKKKQTFCTEKLLLFYFCSTCGSHWNLIGD